MVERKILYDKINHELSVFSTEIELRTKSNLVDANIFAEDFIKDLLNVCMDWNLVNLNAGANNYPGIDLGDVERHIGVQITSTKSSKKIKDSLEAITSNNIYTKFNEIYFLILGRKQKSYAVDFSKYSSLTCSEENIWDISDISNWCAHYDIERMEKIWDVIEREIKVKDSKLASPIEVRNTIFELKRVIHDIIETAKLVFQTYHIAESHVAEIESIVDKLDNLFPYLDENTFESCRKILQAGLELESMVKSHETPSSKIDDKCLWIFDHQLISNILQEAFDLLSDGMLEMKNGINIIIDGDDLLNRLCALRIDQDILYDQFSVAKFQKAIERRLMRKSKTCEIIFAKDAAHCSDEFIRRLQTEGSNIHILENRTQTITFLSEQIKSNIELVLVSSNDDILDKISSDEKTGYLYTIAFEKDFPPYAIPKFFSIGNITKDKLKKCFNYQEGTTVNIKNLTESAYRFLIANANDSIAHQLRVEWSGNVYISTITASEDLKYVKFYWETWNARNDFVGPFAASNAEYIRHGWESVKRNWENGDEGYIDY